ncbi:T9SS type B sorting domain-containing protein [Chryseobacterium viscerum]|uniref:Gliding motility-associated C-terminal domain-containing protein n=1 Tax=Chryseobacterium viscerum TaxID=1037377 RepID=A0A316X2A0_9FLAO|nr:T9SS type B sorting domain-containing protein [Chryseobacterium viscerum]KAB1232089.1 gliding motility-associated C-terminal domain-containing protein [Chryseobacterium viscerum]PWN65398.1 gliding motility-associated C-terminal domain-containing protein [Chryseobacterium viscerum]
MKKILLLFILLVTQMAYSQSDCVTAIPICGNSDISYTPSGPGNIIEILNQNGGCLSTNERYTVWYTFTISTPGTLAFKIKPNDQTDDYDFAVYGPTANGCASLQNASHVFIQPIRCNYSGTAGDTGLDLALAPPAVFPTNPPGNTASMNNGKWSPYMDVLVGQTYYLVIDNFSRSVNGFSLEWTGTASLSSAFNDPVLSPYPFITPGIPGATPNDPSQVMVCALPTQFDFSTLTASIINGNSSNFKVTYHKTTNDALTGENPLTIATVDAVTTYYYRIVYKDPDNLNNPINGCFITGKFKFVNVGISANAATLYSCNNNGAGTAKYNLTTANVFGGTGATIKYYATVADMNAGINEITDPTNYISQETTVYAKVVSTFGCIATTTIRLLFFPAVVLKDAVIENCYIDQDITRSTFDLSKADIGIAVPTPTGIIIKYYTSVADAKTQTNPIATPFNYLSESKTVYARVDNDKQCYSISKIDLKVLPPVKSTVLKDKTICAEGKTTLDAGPGFVSYEWSTGEKTQSISNVGVGVYWVKLQTGKCFTLQEVRVHASLQPVISGIEITNNTITVTATGGVPPYKYSVDGVKWQDSNIFTGLPRGENTVYVKDSYNCTPIQVTVTVPNLINAITPNGDNVNDVIDYSALAYKKNLIFIVYDRYGNKLHEANKMKNFTWDGTAFGKKIPTGTYWYSISWNENNKNSTETKYSGWVLVKNKE